MKLEAIVHPLSISRYDKNYDPKIHIPVEILRSKQFHDEMINLPVTAYHHDTLKAVSLIEKSNLNLNGVNMRHALDFLHNNLPTPQQMAKNVLKKHNLPLSVDNVWATLPAVAKNARGPGVLGKVTRFWVNTKKEWMVEIEVDKTKISPFQLKLITMGGALGQVSLTHAILSPFHMKPLELSFTIEGLRTGSAINRIVSASSKTYATLKKMDVPVSDTKDEIRLFYEQLGELDPTQERNLQKNFLAHMTTISASKATLNTASEQRLRDLEKAMMQVQEATASALNEMGPSCFGNIRQRSPEEWSKNPESLATATEFILAAAASNLTKRKRETDDLDDALKEVSTQRVIAASKAKNIQLPEDDFFKELRNMRQALAKLP